MKTACSVQKLSKCVHRYLLVFFFFLLLSCDTGILGPWLTISQGSSQNCVEAAFVSGAQDPPLAVFLLLAEFFFFL